MIDFFQTPPQLGNQYEEDKILKSYLKRVLPAEMRVEIEPDLIHLGHRVVTDIGALGEAAEACPPKHVPYESWGRRIDKIKTSEAWKQLDRISAEEKLVAIGYERKYGAYSRIYQFAKIYLFHPSSAIYTCPLAMTDGAARVIELYGDQALKDMAFSRLTSYNPDKFWTSGQWMTERTGGSDVSCTSTVAKPEGSDYRLYGTKWFSSATTAQMAMTLARIEGSPTGSKGLSLFYVETHENNIRVNRLKDKLGTCALPTAELTLEGTRAKLVGGVGEGVKKIASLLNITRIYNACCALGYMRRGIALAKDYASKRQAFGRLLSEHPLHQQTLFELEAELEAAFYLVFRTVELLGKEEVGEATQDESALLRVLTPLVKLYTAKQAVAVMSEVLECFGGAGYIEDTGLPKLLRDAQVLSIWEGTTNILSLDVLRAIKKEKVTEAFLRDILNRTSDPKVLESCAGLRNYFESMNTMSEEQQQRGARQLAYRMVKTYAQSMVNASFAIFCDKNQMEVN